MQYLSLLALPFFFAANIIGLSFYHYQEQVSSIYAADLVGREGLCGCHFAVLHYVSGKDTKRVDVIGDFATLVVSRFAFRELDVNTKHWISACIIIGVATAFALTGWMTLNVSPYKSQNQLLQISGTKVIAQYSSPLGFISIVKSADTPLRHAPGLSLNATTEPPEQLAVFPDADNMSAITRYDVILKLLAIWIKQHQPCLII